MAAIIIAIIGVLISLGAVYFTYQGTQLAKRNTEMTERTLRLHLIPVVDCFFSEESKQESKFRLDIKNSGPLSVISVTVDYLNLTFNTERRKIISSGTMIVTPYEKLGKNWLFISDLKPNQIVKKSLIVPDLNFTNKLRGLNIQGIQDEDAKEALASLKNSIDIFYFRLKYFRESDMNEYNKRCVFFLEQGVISGEKEFSTKDYYDDMMRESMSYLKQIDVVPPPIEGIHKAD
jgi:hypothetical protein